MLYREIMAEIHTKHINTVCGQNVEIVNFKTGGIYSNHRSKSYYMLHLRQCFPSEIPMPLQMHIQFRLTKCFIVC